MKVTSDLVAPPITDRYSHVGTAFDYLLRFTLRRANPEVVRGRRWVAEAALDLLTGARREEAQDTIEWANAVRDQYVAGGEPIREVYEAALHLARLDVAVRTGGEKDLEEIEPVTEADIDDLRRLHDCVPVDLFEAETICLLNPTFGKASALVGGADADLLLDDALIEIKTVKEASLSRDALNQLLGYYTLHIIDGIAGLDPKPKIRQIGIYFSRHAHLHTIALDKVIDRKTYPDFVEWFAKYAMKQRAVYTES